MSKKKYTRTTWILIGTNAILVVLLLILWRQYQQQNQILEHSQQSKQLSKYSYKNNPNYTEQLDLNTLYAKQAKIVMLGNSFTYKANWNELLNRHDIANFGIGSDITEGYLRRIQTILSLKPSIVFIEGGINDLALDIAPARTIIHIQQIVDTLLQYNITPILHTILPVHASYPASLRINEKVWCMNQAIIKYANQKHIQVIDLTPQLTSQGFLQHNFVQQDGIHLKAAGYKIWAEQLKNILQTIK